MAEKHPPVRPAKSDPDKEERLKAALKANLARRKAQARARAADDAGDRGEKKG
jgi:hypothetical protein